MNCINLRERYGKEYRITFDVAYDPKGVRKRDLDPWYMQIPCRGGTIYPFGGSRLAVEVDRHYAMSQRLAALGLTLYHDGDVCKEKTYLFISRDFDAVAEIVGARRKRRVGEAQRAAMRERMKRVRN